MEYLYRFTECEFFFEFGLTKVYYHIPLTEKAEHLTAFLTKKRLMEFNRLTFGLVTANSSCWLR